MDKLLSCVICNVPFKHSQSREQHLSDCAKEFHIKDQSLQELIVFRIKRNDENLNRMKFSFYHIKAKLTSFYR
jgi:hypothetical protein